MQPTKQKLVIHKRFKKTLISGLICSSLALVASGCITTEPQNFMDKRTALIEKLSVNDKVFDALKAQIDPKDPHSSEYWRWRTDQYLYGQYPEYQPIYDAHIKGKTFHQIYDMPPEDLGPKKPLPETLPELPEGFFSDNLQGNPHTGWVDFADNKVYVTYQGHLTDPYIASFDIKTQQWDGPYKAAESTLSKGDRKIDSHGRPVIEQDSKGHFHIIYGGHGGEREDGLNRHSIDTPHAGGRMLHVMSEKPNDISKFVYVNDISPFASYAASHKMDNGDIYFFTRMGTHKSPWVYYKMKSGEQRFEPPVKITWPTPQQDNPLHVDTFYINPEKVSATDIAISSLWHECNFLEYHDKTTYARVNSYYMRLDTTTGNFYNAQNEKLELPLTLEVADQKTLAFDSTKREETPFSTKPLILDDGKPAVAYQARTKDYREWRMTKFDNGQWQHSLPMPDSENRTLHDNANNKINSIIGLEVMGKTKMQNTAVVLYKDKKGNAVFATAVRDNADTNSWRVQEEHASVAKARMQMQGVKNDQGDVVAVILNIRKGAAQRLYLWQDGKFHGKS